MKPKVTLKSLKEFIKALRDRKIKYLVIAGFALDGKRGYQTRPHQDLDILCLKEDKKKIEALIKELDYEIRDKTYDKYKLKRRDGSKIDLCLVTTRGNERITKGRIAVTTFPKVLFDKPQKGKIKDVTFSIAPNELLRLWGCSSKKGNDLEYSKTLPVDNNKMKKIKRVLRKI